MVAVVPGVSGFGIIAGKLPTSPDPDIIILKVDIILFRGPPNAGGKVHLEDATPVLASLYSFQIQL